MNETAPSVLYFSRFVPAYRLPVLKLLNERLQGRLTVCSGFAPGSPSFGDDALKKDGSLDLVELDNYWIRGEFLHWQSFEKAFSQRPEANVALIEESPRSLSQRPLIKAAEKRGYGTVLWGHFSSNERALGSQNWRDRIRMNTARKADVLLCYTDVIAEQLENALDGSQRVFVARNALDTRILDQQFHVLSKEGKIQVRARLELPNKPTILYLGRLIESKRVDSMIRAVATLNDFGAVATIIGDGPEMDNLKRLAASLGVSVTFTGALHDMAESAPFIYSADVLAIPGPVGLAVNHAFAFGVPIVTPVASGPGRLHGPEGSYIESGINGVLATDAAPEAMADGIRTVLGNLTSYSEQARATSSDTLGLETMVDGLESAIWAAYEQRQTNRSMLISGGNLS